MIGYVRVDGTTTRKCHLNLLRIVESYNWAQDVMKIVGIQDIPLKQLDCREDTIKPQPVKQTITIKLGANDKEKVINIGSLLLSLEQK